MIHVAACQCGSVGTPEENQKVMEELFLQAVTEHPNLDLVVFSEYNYFCPANREESEKVAIDMTRPHPFVDRMRELDDAFHEDIYEISGRTVLMDTLRPLHRKTQRYRRYSSSIPARRQKSINEHKAICDATCDGDAALAEQLQLNH